MKYLLIPKNSNEIKEGNFLNLVKKKKKKFKIVKKINAEIFSGAL